MDEVVEVAEEVRASNKLVVCVVVAGALGAVLGHFIGYKTAVKYLEPKYAARTEEEIKEAKAFYSTVHKQGKFATPESAVEALIPEADKTLVEAAQALTNYRTGAFEGPQIREESIIVDEVQKNIFDAHEEFVWDYEVEKANRTPGMPYVIHEDEWSERPEGYSMVTVTYYQGDDTLADEKDEPIPDIDGTIGLETLGRFGHGTEDPQSRTVFVRNERLTIDFEVLLHDGKFAHEVLGFQHGEFLSRKDQKYPLRRFRTE